MDNLLHKLASEIRGTLDWLRGNGFTDVENNHRSIDGCCTYVTDAKICFFMKKGLSYADAYKESLKTRAYSFKLLDGAICQMSYAVFKNALTKHRLGFFPSPEQPAYQDDPDLYDAEQDYWDATGPSALVTPVRFDFDDTVTEDDIHPKSHLTLGQYKGCRIPVSAPLSPLSFVRFILSNFYASKWVQHRETYPAKKLSFDNTISEDEMKNAYLEVGKD